MKRVLIVVALLAFPTAQARAEGDPARGQEIYESRCIACHSPDANRVGPMHRGVFGRKAGSLPGYAYSKALKGADFVWNDETLDRWLTNPQAFVPGQKMNFKVTKAEDRTDLIAYLKTLR
ncbi:c-type cytochrome [Dongia sedimenti]|uniref:C-type cytochrome n=1 Tax=Dongia sedimenti TaxID=3064282 RepID=A0ABU0YJ29_9PROT|nr:c-type cytochrome [Rhodospirillaceae bacterium R-7]